MLFQNTGEGFFHPVTHQYIGPGEFYIGAAHLEHENGQEEEPKEQLTETGESESEIKESGDGAQNLAGSEDGQPTDNQTGQIQDGGQTEEDKKAGKKQGK